METFTTGLGSSWGRRLMVVGLAAVVALGLAACGDDDDDAAPDAADGTEDTGGGDTGGGVAYSVTELSYTDVTAPAGGTLEIANESGTSHTFTADDGSFDVSYGGDESATVDVPDSPGDYPFHCNLHSSMEATLTVE